MRKIVLLTLSCLLLVLCLSPTQVFATNKNAVKLYYIEENTGKIVENVIIIP